MQKETVDILPIAVAADLQKQDVSVKIPSGFDCIDNSIDGGFRRGDVTVITGVEGEGKTTLARMLSLNFSKAGIPSMWFSYEMTISELWASFEKMGADHSLISYVPVELEHEVDWIYEHLTKGIKEFGVRAVFIDTIADVAQSEDRRKDAPNHATLIDMLCKDLRDFNIKNDLMLFEIAHATKTTRSRTNETENSDIASSAGIKNAATNILHVWRSKKRGEENISYVKVGKSRRDGTKKDWKYQFKFADNKLLPLDNERYEDLADEFE